MRTALVNGIKSLAKPNQVGICTCCGGQVRAKCGEINTWHWAHTNLSKCDQWWEPETDWHRDWKSHFPIQNQEVIHIDEVTGEKHIADVKTDNNVVLEFQNSAIKPAEIRSREEFYKKMLWIINGIEFKHYFTIIAKLPSLNSTKVKNCRRKYGNYGVVVVCDVLLNGMHKEILIHSAEKYLKDDNSDLFLFHWDYERKCWREATKRIFIDFGNEYLYEIRRYNDQLNCVKLWDKDEFIERATNTK